MTLVSPLPRRLSATCLLACLLSARFWAADLHRPFPADPGLRRLVEQRFARQQSIAAGRREPLFGVFNRPLQPEERDLLRYLYAFMPLSDLADYDGPFFLEAVQATLEARRDLPWAQRIPEEIFRQFVLPLRVNNENLDRFRARMFPELRQRVRHLSMAQAALEINHWCHEKVAYQPSDSRTSAPLATVKTSWGRCGEESTFTVSALRAAAIPARQCYTPRWAHTDDNHAWVEVWVDGSWHFLGACEPEPRLDMGWFKEPARRTMLVHTRAIGPGPFVEPVVESNPFCSVLNLTAHYAPTGSLSVRVVDRNRRPVPGAEVQFLLYNSAELYPLAVQRTGADGRAGLATGIGDLVVWARRGDRYGFRALRVAAATELEVPLDRRAGQEWTLDLDWVPPVEPVPGPADDSGREENRGRLAREDAIRSAYMATFMDRQRAAGLAGEAGFSEPEAAGFLCRSAGNGEEIASFLRRVPAAQRAWALRLLSTLSEKDLRDVTAEVLLAHLSSALALPEAVRLDSGLFASAVLAPRVADEQLVAYREPLRRQLPAALARSGPARLHRWLERRLAVDPTANYGRAPLSPPGALALRRADPLSRDILFVALCRTLGVPARLEPALRFPQYWQNGRWHDAPFAPARREPAAGTVRLANGGGEADPRYYVHFTLARLQNGQLRTLEYDFDRRLSDFPDRLPLPAGDYLLLSGRRLEGGSVLTRLQLFHLARGDDRRLAVELRTAAPEPTPRGRVDPSTPLLFAGGGQATLGELAGAKGAVLLWLAPGEEPSRHVVQDIAAQAPTFAAWGGALAVLLPPGRDAPPEYASLPPQTVYVAEPTGSLQAALTRAGGWERATGLPLVAVCSADGQVRFLSAGYAIGMGDRLGQALSRRP